MIPSEVFCKKSMLSNAWLVFRETETNVTSGSSYKMQNYLFVLFISKFSSFILKQMIQAEGPVFCLFVSIRLLEDIISN